LAYSNVGVKCWRGKVVPGICGGAIRIVAIEKAYNISVKSSFL